MASKYDILNHDSEDARQIEPQGPPLVNLFAAASFVAHMLTANHIPYAVMGGFAMICRGSRRITLDVDVAVNASMKALWAVVEPQPRLVIPDRKLLDGVMKIFVRTGPGHEDVKCTEDRLIEVDLVRPGTKGTPLSLDKHITVVQITIAEQCIAFNCLDILYMMKTKLNHCTSRALSRDLEDIQFLLLNYGDDVRAIADDLDEDDKEYFLDLDPIKSLDEDRQALFRQILHL